MGRDCCVFRDRAGYARGVDDHAYVPRTVALTNGRTATLARIVEGVEHPTAQQPPRGQIWALYTVPGDSREHRVPLASKSSRRSGPGQVASIVATLLQRSVG